MVSFSCETCQDTIKKPKLENHASWCPGPFTCIDCNTTFQGRDWKGHTKCISEEEKYQKTDYLKGKKGGIQVNGKSETADSKNEEVKKVDGKEVKAKETKEGKKTKKDGEKKRKRDEEKGEEKPAEDKVKKTANGAEKKEKKEKKGKKQEEEKTESVDTPEPDVLPFLIDVAPTPQTQLDNDKKRKASEQEPTPNKKNAKKQKQQAKPVQQNVKSEDPIKYFFGLVDEKPHSLRELMKKCRMDFKAKGRGAGKFKQGQLFKRMGLKRVDGDNIVVQLL